MIIRDKQDLRKCVKQCVRRAEVIETRAGLGVLQGELGIAARLGAWTRPGDSLQSAFEDACVGSPFAQRPAALLAALDAMNLPVHDLDKAESIIQGFDREAYLSGILSAMRAKRVLLQVPSEESKEIPFDRAFFDPLLVAEKALFEPGRYGVDYAQAAQRVAEDLRGLNARDVMLECYDESALRFCLIPVCEDTGAVLHVHAASAGQMHAVLDLLLQHNQVRALVSAEAMLEPELIRQAALIPNALIQLGDPASICQALQVFGTRFVPYSSRAESPEEMLGGWVRAKEALWQALYDAYLLLARTGFELTRERIEADVEELLYGSFLKLHE